MERKSDNLAKNGFKHLFTVTNVIILKQLFASGLVNVVKYSFRRGLDN